MTLESLKQELCETAYIIVDTAIAEGVLPPTRMNFGDRPRITLLQLRHHCCNCSRYDTTEKIVAWIEGITHAGGWDPYFAELLLVSVGMIRIDTAQNPELELLAVRYLIGYTYRYGCYAVLQDWLSKQSRPARKPASERLWRETMLSIVTLKELEQDEQYLQSS